MQGKMKGDEITVEKSDGEKREEMRSKGHM